MLRCLRSSAQGRILILRLLLISNVVLLPFLSPPVWLGPSITVFHHILVLFKPVNVKVDIFLVLGEVASLLIPIVFANYLLVIIVGSLNVVFMCLTLYFRLMGDWRGKTDFFSGCDVSGMKSGHRPWAIIFGYQSLAPLVRGESPVIIIIRTCVLIGLTLGIPVFGIYVMFLVPMSSQTMTRDIKVSQSWSFGFTTMDMWLFKELPVQQNITILLLYVEGSREGSPRDLNVAAQGCLTTNSSLSGQLTATVTCPFPWWLAPPGGILLSANFTDPWGILYVKAGQGDISDVDAYTEPIPLVAGARLTAILGLTARKIFSNSAIDLLGLTTLFRTIATNFVLHRQADPAPPNVTDTVTLRLRIRGDVFGVTRAAEDFADTSVLAGFATLGGFWTFTNGAFALIFGANILYFLWKTRPLSALGIIHIFQKRKLIQNWNDDFPLLHTEGGLPGSESAGIVAFLRERLLDVDSANSKPKDAEAFPRSTISPPVVSEKDAGADEIHSPSTPVERRDPPTTCEVRTSTCRSVCLSQTE
ncbi:hypothetical protein DFH08DRAFT_960826 [Mycena albidolilacea]|uniref:Transmembrane protein n=1 Tax=Mycena albidolilacea TaxID=1033008 RepID=A0AAD7A195_9AGAR|nr:hypothetical protein DFH08DRAFT_960826 [Mycena albidolilacea]